MSTYVKPTEAATGQVLGRSYVSVFRDNDQYFMGLADGLRTVPAGEEDGWIGNELSVTIWSGYHLLDANATLLHYNCTLSGSVASPSRARLRLYYNSETIADQDVDGIYSGTHDLSDLDPGVYLVEWKLSRTDGNGSPSAIGSVRAPYTTYTGAEAYTVPPTITDGNVSAASEFNKWRTNDLYFHDCEPREPGFASIPRSQVGSGLQRVLWVGWDRHHYEHTRLYYSVGLQDILSGAYIRIWYDSELLVTINVAGTTSGYVDLAGSYTEGNWYRVQVVLFRTDDEYNEAGAAYYIRMGPVTGDEMKGFTVMDEFAVGQYVYGDSTYTALMFFSGNDVIIRDALTWSDGTGRMDFAVRTPRSYSLNGTERGYYYFLRQRDYLYYVGGGSIRWGTSGTHRLTDTDESNPYLILDLRTLPDFPMGIEYYIDGFASFFAMEV